MKPLSIQIVPASPGFLTVYDFDDTKEIEVCEPIIAWRVETYSKKEGDELFSSCVPITVDGDAGGNCIGVQNPDMTVTIFDGALYKSLEELRKQKYPVE